MNSIDLNYRLNQERLKTLHQEAQLRTLLKDKHPSWKYRIAKTLHSLALRLYPEVENQGLLYSKTQ